MLDLSDNALQKILPSSISSDATVKDIVKAISAKLVELNNQSENVLLLPRLSKLNEKVVDELAWQYHVDFYESTLSISKKRALVKKAIAQHRYKGTLAAVEEVCSDVFNSAAVQEWYAYDNGQPYHFKVRITQEAIPGTATITSITQAINATKNTRSWLDGLNFTYQPKGTVYCAGVMCRHKRIDFTL